MTDSQKQPAARGAWMASGLAFFAVGVAFSITMPDNIAMGITFLALGVVFFSLAGAGRRTRGSGESDGSGGSGGSA